MRSSKYNAAVLAPIVQRSHTIAEVLRSLGLPATGGNYRMIGARLRHERVDTSHFRSQTIVARCEAVPPDTLRDLVKQSKSVAAVLAKLGMPTEGRSHRELKRIIERLELDTAHFRGKAWNRGETRDTHPSVARTGDRTRMPDSEIFIENSAMHSGPRIVRRLLELEWPYWCSWCGLVEWRGKRLVLHLDHINGICNDNRFINLRLLCPNCHSQTETYSNSRRA